MRFFAFISSFLIASTSFCQSVGSKVRMIPSEDGKQYTGVITGINGDKFKVKYDGFEFDSWLLATQFTVLDNKKTETPSTVNGQFKVGDKIKAKDDYNLWLDAEILEVSNGKYKVHYKDYSNSWDQWIPENRIQSITATSSNNANTNTNVAKNPEMIGGIPKIAGTAWSLVNIYDKGKKPGSNFIQRPYLFCKSGRWEMQTPIFQMGNYRVSGNKLTQISDGSDHLTETYIITWNAAEKYMELTSSTTVIRLIYNTTTTC